MSKMPSASGCPFKINCNQKPCPFDGHGRLGELGEMQTHWLNCERCGLSKLRRHVVLGRGEIPAQLLMIGEAPGKSEDLRGEPFVGVSGIVLNHGIARAAERAEFLPTIYITNTVGCRPTERAHGENREPEYEEALACWPRIQELEQLVMPDMILFLGNEPERHLKPQFPWAEKVRHPAMIARAGGLGSGEYRIFVRKLEDLFKQLGDPKWIAAKGGSYHV